MTCEQFTSEQIVASSQGAYTTLSNKRGYAVEPGDCVCVFVSGLMVTDLQSQGVDAEQARYQLKDGSSNWMVRIGKSTLVDATWFSMLADPLREGQPSIIVIDKDRGDIKGISGEELSDAAVAYYFSQYARYLFCDV